MSESDIQEIIRQLKEQEICVFDVPSEHKNNSRLVTFERERGLRVTGRKGFDVIANSFFVEEELIHLSTNGVEQKKAVSLSFVDFEAYYAFLNGDIYNNACYMFCPISNDIAFSHKIDWKKWTAKKAFTEKTMFCM